MYLMSMSMSGQERPSAVWNDLGVHGYRHDLRREADVAAEELAAQEASMRSMGAGDTTGASSLSRSTLPRAILSSTEAYFQLLFQSLCLADPQV